MNKDVMPIATIKTKTMASSIDYVLHTYRKFKEENSSSLYPWANRFICGFPIPDFQRQIVWTLPQMEAFIMSVWIKNPIGTYMINDNVEIGDHVDGAFPLYCDALLDGQQRLTALQYYFDNKISIKGTDGKRYVWSDLSIVTQRRFRNTSFGREFVSVKDLYVLKELYNLRNFTGVAHQEHERAV